MYISLFFNVSVSLIISEVLPHMTLCLHSDLEIHKFPVDSVSEICADFLWIQLLKSGDFPWI